MALSVERSIQGTFGAILAPPTVTSTSVGTTAQVLITDSTADPATGVREVLLCNTHASQTLYIGFFAKGATVTGMAVTDGIPVPAGGSRSLVIGAGLRLAVMASGAATTYTVLVSDK